MRLSHTTLSAPAAMALGLAMLFIQPTARAREAPTQDPTTLPLLGPASLKPQCAFRLPHGTIGSSTFAGGGRPLAFHPTNGTLLITGIGQYQVAEVDIPLSCPPPTSLDALPIATIRTPFRSVVNLSGLDCSEAKLAGGYLPWLGDLIVSGYCYFESGVEKRSHWRVSGGTATGPVQVGSLGAGFVSAWMTPIPPEWRAAFGGSALTGNGSIPIISRTSSGPAASVFNPSDVGVKNPVPATPVVGYPYSDNGATQTLGKADSDGTLYNSTQYFGGMVFPSGTSTVLFFAGRKALGGFCYGPGTTDQSLHLTPYPGAPDSETWCYDPVNFDKGTHGYPYAHFVYAYNASDLVAVKNGQKAPWEVIPYATWTFDLPFQYGQRVIDGVGYDQATQRIFLAAGNGDGDYPLIHVVTVDAAVSEPPPPDPPADTIAPSVTLTVDPSAPASGSLVALSAAAIDNVGVIGVQFTVNGSALGPEDTTAPYSASWQPATAGTYNVRALARDMAGNLGSAATAVVVTDPTVPPPPPPLPSTCLVAPGVLRVSQWPSPNEGSRRLTYSYTVEGAVTVVASFTHRFGPPDTLTVIDARGCMASDVR